VGERLSGAPVLPFMIVGNGAVVSGAKPVPADTWQLVADQTWRITPVAKAYYQLVLNGEAVPEVAYPRDAAELPDLPEGHWCAWRGAVYYRAALRDDPREMDFALADEDVGITLLDVHDVVIRDLTLRHFRLDGINAHDRCRNVLLQNVTCEQNGRAGVAVAGTSLIRIEDSRLIDNRAHSLLISELGEADVENCELDAAPTLTGHVR
jgi:hypothetical protein